MHFPKFDPHGDPIPNAFGVINNIEKKTLFEIEPGNLCKMVGVKDDSAAFLQYVDQLGLSLNKKVKIISRQDYDHLTVVEIDKNTHSITQKFAENIFVV